MVDATMLSSEPFEESKVNRSRNPESDRYTPEEQARRQDAKALLVEKLRSRGIPIKPARGGATVIVRQSQVPPQQ
jgi:hypothetical protein